MPSSTKTFYKYITPTALAGLLTNGNLKLSLKEDVNDPFELSPYAHSGLAGIDKEYGFISLSGSPQISSLWGNYADCYRGACLEFEFEHLTSLNDKSAEMTRMGEVMSALHVPLFPFKKREARASTSTDDFFNGTCIIKCQYQTSRVNLSNYTESYIDTLVRDSSSPSYLNIREKLLNWLKVADVIRTKHILWHTEDEYRTFMKLCNASSHQFINGKLMYFTNNLTKYIKRIIISESCAYKKHEIESAIKLASKKEETNIRENIEVIEASFSENHYTLEGIPLSEDAEKRAIDNDNLAQAIEIFLRCNSEKRKRLLELLQANNN